jgi:hypothetical protein
MPGHNSPRDKYYSAVQGGFGPDRGAEERSRLSTTNRESSDRLLGQVAGITGLSNPSGSSLSLTLFNFSISGETLLADKSPAQAVVSSLLFLSKCNVPEAESKALLVACSWIYRESQQQSNKSEYVGSFTGEAQNRINGADLTSTETTLLKRFIDALSFVDSELTWSKEFLFNPNPHPNRTP